MEQDYETWVIIDPVSRDWTKTRASSLQNAAETAALEYDQRADVDFSLSKGNTVVQVLVRDSNDGSKAYSFEVSCTLNPFYEITGGGTSSTLTV